MTWGHNNRLTLIGVEMGASASLKGIDAIMSSTTEFGDGVTGSASTQPLTPNLSQVKASTTLGVTLGPDGLSPEIRGQAAANVLGQNLFEAKIP